MKSLLLGVLLLFAGSGGRASADVVPEVSIPGATDDMKETDPSPPAQSRPASVREEREEPAAPLASTDNDWLCSFQMLVHGSWRPGAAFADGDLSIEDAVNKTIKHQAENGIAIRNCTCERECEVTRKCPKK